jgi:hypothetical protein
VTVIVHTNLLQASLQEESALERFCFQVFFCGRPVLKKIGIGIGQQKPGTIEINTIFAGIVLDPADIADRKVLVSSGAVDNKMIPRCPVDGR